MSCECTALELARFPGVPFLGNCPPPVPAQKYFRRFAASINWGGFNFDGGRTAYTTKTIEITDGNGTRTITETRARASEGGEITVNGDPDFRTDWELITRTSTEATYRGGGFAQDDRKIETLSAPYDPAEDLDALIGAVSAHMDGAWRAVNLGDIYHAFYEPGTGRIIVEGPNLPAYTGARTLQGDTALFDKHETCQCDAYAVKRNFGNGSIGVAWVASEVRITAPWYERTYSALTRFDSDGYRQVRERCCVSTQGGSLEDSTVCGDVSPGCAVRTRDSVNNPGLEPEVFTPSGFNQGGVSARLSPACNLAP